MLLNMDINCDLGESYGHFKVGNDEALFPFLTSCNIACGFHGGDPLHIENTIILAMQHQLRIGAHPSYPDLAGFGRRSMQLETNELKAIVKYQIVALKGMVESHGGRLAYVKPHGALYNKAAVDASECQVIIDAIKEIDPSLALMGLAGSIMESIAAANQLPFIAEAFADRRYTQNGQLQARSAKNAVINNVKEAVEQVLSIINEQKVQTTAGGFYPINAQSICVHGDTSAALDILRAIHHAFKVGF